ncbi:alpha/beta hydrolase [Streptomyces sp. NRRL S-1521]|uniref:alpha/beta hydrolase n=1 Tax=Streptomyces sp. NRRL S-1521 TaxID=1609100 RepID=UPI0022793CF3|nr:alpha/beta hydrolase fold domain-containing protein [Streptomyces sp. NRRL S-1521]
MPPSATRARSSAATPRSPPLLTDLSGLPPMILHGGSNEILRRDFEQLAEKAGRHDLELTLRIFPRQWHVFHMFARVHREAADAISVLAGDVRSTTGALPTGTGPKPPRCCRRSVSED